LCDILVLIEDTVTNGGMRSCASCPTDTVPDDSGFNCVGETSTFDTVGEYFVELCCHHEDYYRLMDPSNTTVITSLQQGLYVRCVYYTIHSIIYSWKVRNCKAKLDIEIAGFLKQFILVFYVFFAIFESKITTLRIRHSSIH